MIKSRLKSFFSVWEKIRCLCNWNIAKSNGSPGSDISSSTRKTLREWNSLWKVSITTGKFWFDRKVPNMKLDFQVETKLNSFNFHSFNCIFFSEIPTTLFTSVHSQTKLYLLRWNRAICKNRISGYKICSLCSKIC